MIEGLNGNGRHLSSGSRPRFRAGFQCVDFAMGACDGTIGCYHKDRVVQCVGLRIPFRMGEEYGHLQAGCELTHADHPWVGLWYDPVRADGVGECVPADTQFRGDDTGSS